MLLAGLEKRPDIAETLNASFERMLARYRRGAGGNAGTRAEAEETGLPPPQAGLNTGFQLNGASTRLARPGPMTGVALLPAKNPLP